MEREQYRAAALTVLRIAGFVQGENGLTAEALRGCDMELLYRAAERHQLTALTAYGLRRLGLENEAFKVAAAKAKRKDLLFGTEFKRLTGQLADAHIPYMPLKGMLLRELYPLPWLREMSDIDIWFDETAQERVRDLMLRAGYEIKHYGKTNHDVYRKPPFYLVEMHRALFDSNVYPVPYRYFQSKTYAVSGHSPYLHEMTADEMYVYLIAHAHIHYISAGTGLRTLVDLHVFLKRYENRLDFTTIHGELEALGMAEFEAEARALSQKLFAPQTLSEKERSVLDYYIFSGTHGNYTQFLQNRMDHGGVDGSVKSKLRYLGSRFAVPARDIRQHPFYSKHPRMVWLMQLSRPFRIFAHPKKTFHELKLMIKK